VARLAAHARWHSGWTLRRKIHPHTRFDLLFCSNNLRNDLSHPNEFIRGCTLRFLCKLKESEILEPLIPTIKNNLEHRHGAGHDLAFYFIKAPLPRTVECKHAG